MKRSILILTLLAVAGLVVAGCECPPEQVAYNPPPPSPQPAEQPCPPTGNVSERLSVPAGSAYVIEKSGPEQVIVGNEYSYTVTLKNASGMALSNVRITEELAQGFNYVSSSPQGQKDGNNLIWTLPTLAADESRTFTVTGTAAGTGDLRSCAVVTHDPPELCLITKAIQPILEVALEGPKENIVCDPLTYRVVVKNTGSGTACNVVVKNTLPEGMELMDGSREWSKNVGNLGAGESKEFTLQTRVISPGQVSNQASATADGNLSAQSARLDTKITKPVLVVTKSAPAMRYVGRPIKYTITVANQGDAEARNTVLKEKLTAATEFVSASNNGSQSDGSIRWSLGTINPGDSKQVEVTIRPNQKGNVKMVTEASSYCGEGSGESEVAVRGIPAIMLETIDLHDPIEVSANTTYEINVTNQGSAEDTNIRIVATLPAELEFVSADGPTKASVNGQVITFEPVKTLVPKDKITFKVVAKALKPGDVRFHVELNSDQMSSPASETEPTTLYQ